jgi:hypothetical protein
MLPSILKLFDLDDSTIVSLLVRRPNYAAADLNRVLAEHEQATEKLYRESHIRLELAKVLRASVDAKSGVGHISSQAELAANLRCTVETVERYLCDMSGCQ